MWPGWAIAELITGLRILEIHLLENEMKWKLNIAESRTAFLKRLILDETLIGCEYSYLVLVKSHWWSIINAAF